MQKILVQAMLLFQQKILISKQLNNQIVYYFNKLSITFDEHAKIKV